MKKETNLITKGTCRQILRQNHTNTRITKQAINELQTLLNETATMVTQRAHKLRQHRGKPTLTKEDIQLAIEQLEQEE